MDMKIDPQSIEKLSVENLARICAYEASRRCAPESLDRSACYELFRRACSPPFDDAAWQAIHTQYKRLVLSWLGQYASDDTVQDAFLRFFQAQQNSAQPFIECYPNIASVIQYLKSCATSARYECWFAEQRHIQLVEKLEEAAAAQLKADSLSYPNREYQIESFKSVIFDKLRNEQEEIVFVLTYTYGLPPREIQAQYPHLFSNVDIIYRIKENMLKRLKRDGELKKWWSIY